MSTEDEKKTHSKNQGIKSMIESMIKWIYWNFRICGWQSSFQFRFKNKFISTTNETRTKLFPWILSSIWQRTFGSFTESYKTQRAKTTWNHDNGQQKTVHMLFTNINIVCLAKSLPHSLHLCRLDFISAGILCFSIWFRSTILITSNIWKCFPKLWQNGLSLFWRAVRG